MNISDAYSLINGQAMANNVWSAQQAQKQMEFQERMSSTAHQREVADLKAAGLNPVLSAGGSGASTPTGAMGGTDTSNTSALLSLLSQSISSNASSAGSVGRIAEEVTKGLNNALEGFEDVMARFQEGAGIISDSWKPDEATINPKTVPSKYRWIVEALNEYGIGSNLRAFVDFLHGDKSLKDTIHYLYMNGGFILPTIYQNAKRNKGI